MDAGDVTQLIFVVTIAGIMGRVGLAFARLVERRAAGKPSLPEGADERLRALEGECMALRQEVAELQERQDFTERALVQDSARQRPALPADRDRARTPR
jgi:hypothetical protein